MMKETEVNHKNAHELSYQYILKSIYTDIMIKFILHYLVRICIEHIITEVIVKLSIKRRHVRF